jgi:hypothetical protein
MFSLSLARLQLRMLEIVLVNRMALCEKERSYLFSGQTEELSNDVALHLRERLEWSV